MCAFSPRTWRSCIRGSTSTATSTSPSAPASVPAWCASSMADGRRPPCRTPTCAPAAGIRRQPALAAQPVRPVEIEALGGLPGRAPVLPIDVAAEEREHGDDGENRDRAVERDWLLGLRNARHERNTQLALDQRADGTPAQQDTGQRAEHRPYSRAACILARVVCDLAILVHGPLLYS